MTQEEKEILLKDLCARLPYDVQGITSEGVITPLLHRGEADWDILTSLNYRIVKYGWRPYLRPMSSMTKEERKAYKDTMDKETQRNYPDSCDFSESVYYSLTTRSFDWLNEHHFDYRGLIHMGLAIKAPEGMYDTKTE